MPGRWFSHRRHRAEGCGGRGQRALSSPSRQALPPRHGRTREEVPAQRPPFPRWRPPAPPPGRCRPRPAVSARGRLARRGGFRAASQLSVAGRHGAGRPAAARCGGGAVRGSGGAGAAGGAGRAVRLRGEPVQHDLHVRVPRVPGERGLRGEGGGDGVTGGGCRAGEAASRRPAAVGASPLRRGAAGDGSPRPHRAVEGGCRGTAAGGSELACARRAAVGKGAAAWASCGAGRCALSG